MGRSRFSLESQRTTYWKMFARGGPFPDALMNGVVMKRSIPLPDDQHRAGRGPGDSGGDAAQHAVFQIARSSCADDHEIVLPALRLAQDFIGRVALINASGDGKPVVVEEEIGRAHV